MIENLGVVPDVVGLVILFFQGVNDLVVRHDFFVFAIVSDNTKTS